MVRLSVAGDWAIFNFANVIATYHHNCLVILKLQPVKISTGLIEVFNLISVISFWQQFRTTIVSCQCFTEAGAQCWRGGEPALSQQSTWRRSPWWRWRGGGGTWKGKKGKLWPRRGRLKKACFLLLPPFSHSLMTSYWECWGSCRQPFFMQKSPKVNSDWSGTRLIVLTVQRSSLNKPDVEVVRVTSEGNLPACKKLHQYQYYPI